MVLGIVPGIVLGMVLGIVPGIVLGMVLGIVPGIVLGWSRDRIKQMIRFNPKPIRHPIRHPIHSSIYLNYPTDDGYPYLKRIIG